METRALSVKVVFKMGLLFRRRASLDSRARRALLRGLER
jgi:hypothetical protein